MFCFHCINFKFWKIDESHFWEKPLRGSFISEVIWVITAMPDTEINTCRFRMRRKGFHYYYFFPLYYKNYAEVLV